MAAIKIANQGNIPTYVNIETAISGRDKWLHPTVFYGMQLLIHAWNKCLKVNL